MRGFVVANVVCFGLNVACWVASGNSLNAFVAGMNFVAAFWALSEGR